MQQNSTKIIISVVIAFTLLVVSVYKLDSNFFTYLSELISGSYKNQVAKIDYLNSPKSTENLTRATSTAPIKKCTYETTLSPTHTGAIFSEIAWMGDGNDTTNEWIVIKKMSSAETNVSNWQIVNQNEKLKIMLPKGKILTDAKPTFTIARHSKINGIVPDFVFIGLIKNTNEGLRLFDSNCNLIDEVVANPNWPAGNNGSTGSPQVSSKKPMVRLTNLSWQTKGNIVTSEVKTTPQATPKCVNINTAPDVELQKITHIGPKLALQIIQLRTDKQLLSVDDLIKVKGIGSSTLADIKKQGIACVDSTNSPQVK